MKKIPAFFAAGLMLAGVSPSAMSAAPTAGEVMANSCFSCHGYNGQPVPGSTIPPLGIFPAQHIEQQMLAFKNGSRPSTVMGRHAKGYTEEEIKILSQYLGHK